jgi:hypothetical protein
MQADGGLHRSPLATPLEVYEADHDEHERQEPDKTIH